MTTTRRNPLELKHVEGENVRSTGPCTTRFDRFPCNESSASLCLERDERFAGVSRLVSAIAALVSSRPPVVMLRQRVLARPIRLWLCNTPYANMVVSLKSPTHHTASMYVRMCVLDM